MKKILGIYLVILSLTWSSCGNKTPHEKDSSSLNFDWLVGNWIRTNGDAGKRTVEYWTRKSNEEYIGFGCTTQNSDTLFKENMRILKINENWNLEVTGVNENPTFFAVANQAKNRFVCKNENNEFPKKIEYSLDGNKLVAKISDDNTEIHFIFKKLVSQ